MAEENLFSDEVEKSFTQKYIEGFGLEFPKDADKFLEIFEKFSEQEGTFDQFVDELIEAFPDKKESILNVTVLTDEE
jgi:hypothetical protein